MGSPLTIASDVECGHKGVVEVTSSVKLTVNGSPVLLEASVASMPVTPGTCATQQTSTTSPCKTVTSVLPPSLATKLTVGGKPVVLDSLKGLTDGVPPGGLLATAGQSKLTAI